MKQNEILLTHFNRCIPASIIFLHNYTITLKSIYEKFNQKQNIKKN